jgi:hypothetical protein
VSDTTVVALITAIPPTVLAAAAWYTSVKNGRKLATNSNRTIGEHVEFLQEELSRVAQAKQIADAKITAEALAALAKLTNHRDLALLDAAEVAADKVAQLAETTAKKLADPFPGTAGTT